MILLSRLRHYLELVRFSHTLFALPFALAAMFWAAGGWPRPQIFLLILACMALCRNAAMAFNRLVDAGYDARNPRTRRRHLPAGLLGRKEVAAFLAMNGLLFVVATRFLNPLAFALSLPTLAAVCFYSLTKRFTAWSHLFLGLAIGISPMGAWIAVQGRFGAPAFWLCLALGLWIAGFDVIYATQDHEFDAAAGLHSLVVRYGIARSLRVSALLHAGMFGCLVAIAARYRPGWVYTSALAGVAALLVYLHGFRRGASLDGLNQDFFLANIAISGLVLLGIAGAVFWTWR